MNKFCKLIAVVCLLGTFTVTGSQEARASENSGQIGVKTSSSYLVKVDAPTAYIYAETNETSSTKGRVTQGSVYQVIACKDGWAQVRTETTQGYLKLAGQATMVETTREEVDQETLLREEVVNYALQFVGNSYRYGGSDPNSGVDCSGFTSYVIRHVAGVSLKHSSSAQAGEGREVDVPKPGDLIFYGNGKRINHVAIYMGNGQVVHASSARTGITISNWKYRTPVKIVDVLS